ncbi:hypothetical protein AGLY_001358 [Aphis glycines]|uniref:Uncharacterized protein n=1 Tax=Aphis glycines TaxID=307491 RepID=A0A6G0U6E0_APHGL|nr:hypothetical protein AGLY_001358 [Aphis glycines]
MCTSGAVDNESHDLEVDIVRMMVNGPFPSQSVFGIVVNLKKNKLKMSASKIYWGGISYYTKHSMGEMSAIHDPIASCHCTALTLHCTLRNAMPCILERSVTIVCHSYTIVTYYIQLLIMHNNRTRLRNLNCNANIKIIVKKDTTDTRKKDKCIRQGLNTEIKGGTNTQTYLPKIRPRGRGSEPFKYLICTGRQNLKLRALSCSNLTIQKHEFYFQNLISIRKTKSLPNMAIIFNESDFKTEDIGIESTFKTADIINVRQLKKVYSTSCPNISLNHESTIKNSKTIIKAKSLLNMALAYNEL